MRKRISRTRRSHASVGAPSEAWDLRVREILFHMAAQGALSEPALFEALAQPLTFASPLAAEQRQGEPREGP